MVAPLGASVILLNYFQPICLLFTQNVIFDIDGFGISISFNVTFSVNNVLDKLSNLSGIKSVEPVGKSGEFLFQLCSVLCYLLWMIFRPSLDECIFPFMLKFSSVTPILKSLTPSTTMVRLG